MCKWVPPSAGLRPGLPSQALLRACLLLVLAAGTTLAGFPAPGSEDEVQKPLLQVPAETARLSWDLGRRARSYNHLEGDVRLRQLYSANKFFLSIDSRGRVRGSRHRNQTNSEYVAAYAKVARFIRNLGGRGAYKGVPDLSLLEIRSVSMGVVVIRSVSTGLYLAMSKKGALYGSAKYTADCQFRERIEENGYNTYAALRWRRGGRPMFVSLGGRGRPRGGHRTRRRHRSAHFLPMLPT